MNTWEQQQRLGLMVVGGIVGAVAGALLGPQHQIETVLALGIAGIVAGLRLGDLIFRKAKAPSPQAEAKFERMHYHLSKEMWDGYRTGLVMKRIMEVYHAGETPAEPEAETEWKQEEGEEEAEDPFETWKATQAQFDWPNKMEGLLPEKDKESKPEAQQKHDDKSGR